MNDRTCIVTKESGARCAMLRFVLGPDQSLIPDLKENLPGRGAWLRAKRSVLEQAIKQKAFSRSFKAPVHIAPDLADLTDHLLKKAVLGSLSLAKKAGGLVTGSCKVIDAIKHHEVALVLHAKDAAEDGRRKILQAIHARERQGLSKVSTSALMTSEELSPAFGGQTVMHIAIFKKKSTDGLLTWIRKLQLYRGKALSQDAKAVKEAQNNE